MSYPSNGHSPSIQNLPQPHNYPQQKTPEKQMDSDTSVKTDSTQASLTPPTTYDDVSNSLSEDDVEDELKDKEADTVSDSDHDQKKDVLVDPICAGEADGQCTLNSGDHRKVTSHVFGRNKRETHQIPEECWIKYCRKHYQRQKYRCPADWFETQLLLVDGQLDRLEAWGGVIDWTIQLRKKERESVDRENHHQAIHGSLPDGPLARERFLLPYLGQNKTFAEVRAVVDVINKECDDTQNLTLPSFEFLPRIDERRNPRPRRSVARRGGTRQPAPRTHAGPSTFRLTTDGSGQLTKIETKPRQTSGTGYALAKERTLAKKRSASALKAEQAPEPTEPTEPTEPIPKRHEFTFWAVDQQPMPHPDDGDKKTVGDEVQRPVGTPVTFSSIVNGKHEVDVSNKFPRPVKRHRRSRSV